jgi:proline dehydrogenase
MNLFNRFVVGTLPFVPRSIVRHFAGRYIAGESLDEAVACVRRLNSEGRCATLDVLGEDVTTEGEAIGARDQNLVVLDRIAQERIDSNLSIKLTSLGLKLGKELCTGNVREILKRAKQHGIFVRFDMEDSTCTSDTIDVFETLNREYPQSGIVIQAYLHRSEADVRKLAAKKTNFRLCKGIYKEKPSVAIQGREEVQQNFLLLLRIMLEQGSYVGIATHDSVLVDGALKMIGEMSLDGAAYEFQMLLGVRPELRRKLAEAGHRVRLYVPFGEHWYGYSIRRFKENPEIAGYILRALFRRNV